MEKLRSALVSLLVAALCTVGLYWSVRPQIGGDDPPAFDDKVEEEEETWSAEELALISRFLQDVGVSFEEGEQYRIVYASNGDGTCDVTEVWFNPLNREEISLVIPETSPDGETVVRISARLTSPDHGVPPILSKPSFEALVASLGELYGYGSVESREIEGSYTLYDATLAEDPEEYEEMLRLCPLLEWTPCALLNRGIYETDRIGLAERARLAGGLLDTVDYLAAYYGLLDELSGEGEQALLMTWDVRNALRDSALLCGVEMPDTVTEIADKAFMGCHGLQSVRLSESLRRIPKDAFRGTGLFEIILPDSVQVIGEYAFNGCFSLVRAELGAGLRDIGAGAFWCPKLIEIQNRSPLRIEAASSSGGYGNISDYARWVYVEDYEGSRIVRDGDFVFYVSEEAGEYLLLDYRGSEEEIELPSDVNGHAYGIYDGAFYGERRLRSVLLGDGALYVSSGAFSFCTALETVGLGRNTETVEEGAFAASCPRIVAFLVDGENPFFESVDGVLYTEGLDVLCRYPARREGVGFTVPDGVRMLSWDPFRGPVLFDSVELPHSVESLYVTSFRSGVFVVYHGTQAEWLDAAPDGNPCPMEEGTVRVSCTDGELWFSVDS